MTVALYPDLLRISLLGTEVECAAPTESDALAYLLRCRERVVENRAATTLEAGAAQLAVNLSCDVALIHLARTCGIACDVQDFADPDRERLRIEQELVLQGVMF